ncbi:MAG TPA: DegQ family serine endoprotease [Candidatus Limnocylindrales bacterium]|nr:DegQ family serine endoprotease [Candidatus Limnocylindrales bacterium]
MFKSKATWVVLGLILLFLVGILDVKVKPSLPSFADERQIQDLQKMSFSFRTVAKKVTPTVVNISVVQTIRPSQFGFRNDPFRDFFGDDFFERFFGIPREFKNRGLGSGVIVSEKGYILTNNHVVGKADEIKVTLADKREFTAKVVGTDPKSDVAVIQIKARDLPVARLGNSDDIEVGDWVVAIGNPFGLNQTVTVGVISAKGRANMGIADYEDFIQTDAAINPGNSGGPLVNLDGEVIGINTAIFSRSGGYQGIGFAIPINMAKSIMQSLIENGKIVRGWLGVQIQPVTEDVARSFGLSKAEGVLVGDVTKGSPAERAGFKRGDIIIRYGNRDVNDPNQLRNMVASTPVGEKVPIEIIRDGHHQTLTVEIAELPAEIASAGTPGKEVSELGIQVQNLTPDLASRLGYEGDHGVVVVEVEPGSLADESGIQRGDLIKEVNRQEVRNLSDYNRAIAKAGKSDQILFLIRRGDSTFYLILKR